MRSKRLSFLVIILTAIAAGWLVPVTAKIITPVLSMAALPIPFLEKHFQTIEQEFDQRVVLFLKGRPFKNWEAKKTKEALIQEFNQLNDWRFHAWYIDPESKTLIAHPDFMVAQSLLEKGFYQKLPHIAFQYNLSDGSYNSSSVIINGYKFLALEAPTAKTLRNFFMLIQNFQVTQLVRLSGPEENGANKNSTYWVGRLKMDPKTKEIMLNVPQLATAYTYPVRYYSTDNFPSGKSMNPKELLQLIQAVRSGSKADGLIACHSTSGAGRTGTFIAGFLLISELDKQIASGVTKNSLQVSIEKLVMQLSLQRPYLVNRPDQYITLYRLIDLYMAGLK